jgi:hypothetical protein
VNDNIYESNNYIMNISELNAWAMSQAENTTESRREAVYEEVANALECVQQGYAEWSACQQSAAVIQYILDGTCESDLQ